MKRACPPTLIPLLIMCAALAAQDRPRQPEITERHYRVYRADGSAAAFADVLAAARSATVTFLGEQHDDPVAHYLELQLLKGLTTPRLIFGLEMFERDVQHVMNEYLAGLITEEHLTSSGRAPRSYKTDYRPLIDHAKDNRIPVLASNAPRRYVNRVSRLGKDSLAALPESAKSTLAPLPYADATPDYAERFRKVMEEADKEQPAGQSPRNPVFSLQAQSLWDATMAFSIAEALTRQPQAQILHVNGAFHTEHRLGIVDHLSRYRPGVRVVVVTMLSRKDFPKWVPDDMEGGGDFVIVTDASPK